MQQRRHQGQGDDRHVYREHEARRAADVVVDAPALADRRDDAGEAVVEQHQRGGFARDIGAALAHRDADIRGLQRRRVVNAVAGHCHDFAAGAQHLHEAQFLHRLQARAQVDVAQALAQLRVVERVDFRAGDDVGAFAQADLARDRACGGRVVAGHHDDADAGGAAFGDRGGDFRPRRIDEADQAEEAEIEIVLAARRLRALPVAARDAEHAQAAFGHALDLRQDARALVRRQVAQVDHRFRRALGGKHVPALRVAAVRQRHRQDVRRQRVLELRRPLRVHVLGAFEPAQSERLDRLFHRIERIGRRRQHRELDQRVERFGQVAGAFVAERSVGDRQFVDLHAIARQRAGLVDRQQRDRTQRLDRRHAPRQYLALRDAPRAKGEKHGQDHRNFFRQDRHRQGDAGEQAFEQRVSVPQPVEQAIDARQCQAADAQVADQATRGSLQAGCRFAGRRERLADAADRGVGADRVDLRDADALGHDRARAQPRRRRARQPRNRDRLAGQQRLVDVQVAILELRIGGDAIALVQHEQVADHDLAPGNAQFAAIADHQRARRGQVAQRFERALGAAFLHQGDADDDEHEREQEHRLGAVAEREVERTGAEQHQEHRLEQHAGDDREQRTRRRTRQHVRAVRGEPARSLVAIEAACACGKPGGGGHRAPPVAAQCAGAAPRISLRAACPARRASSHCATRSPATAVSKRARGRSARRRQPCRRHQDTGAGCRRRVRAGRAVPDRGR